MQGGVYNTNFGYLMQFTFPEFFWSYEYLLLRRNVRIKAQTGLGTQKFLHMLEMTGKVGESKSFRAKRVGASIVEGQKEAVLT